MFYDKFISACEMAGISPSNALTSLGVSKSNLSRWSKGGDASNELKKKIADHLHIPLSQLLDKKEKPTQKREPEEVDLDIMDKFMRLNQDQKRLLLVQVTAWLND